MKPIFQFKITADSVKSLQAEPIAGKEKILRFMRSFSPVSITGKVIDLVTGAWTDIDNLDYETDEFYWSESDIYHFEKYNLKLDDDFIQYALKHSK